MIYIGSSGECDIAAEGKLVCKTDPRIKLVCFNLARCKVLKGGFLTMTCGLPQVILKTFTRKQLKRTLVGTTAFLVIRWWRVRGGRGTIGVLSCRADDTHSCGSFGWF